MNSSRRHFLRAGAKFSATAIVWTSSDAPAGSGMSLSEGEKTTWHDGFDRYDFIHGRCHWGDYAYDGTASEGDDLRNRRVQKRGVAPLRRSRPKEKLGARLDRVVMAGLAIGTTSLNPKSKRWGAVFSHRLCGARPRQTGQGVGPVVQVPDGKLRPGRRKRQQLGMSKGGVNAFKLGCGQPGQGGLSL